MSLDSKDFDSFLWYNATIFPSGLTAKYNGSRRTLVGQQVYASRTLINLVFQTIEGNNTRNVYSRALVSVQFYNQLSSPAFVPSHQRYFSKSFLLRWYCEFIRPLRFPFKIKFFK